MQLASTPPDPSTLQTLLEKEEARLRALQDLDLLDTAASESFDRITRMASRLFQAPISAVSLTDQNRQWFKSHVGTNGNREVPRFQAPCAEVTRTGEFLVVPDLREDPRFADSLVAQSGARFYAGAPLTTRDGHTLGSMCVLDPTPRSISPEERDSLQDFAAMVMAQIELQHDFGRVDPLSGLPNRNQLTEDLNDMERDHAGENRVLILIDLADPRQFNQLVSVLGTVYIDELVKASSRAIQDTLGGRRNLYQVGAGSFVAVVDESKGEAWRDIVGRLTVRLKTPLVCKGVPIALNAAFGISPLCLQDSASCEALRTAVSAAHDARKAELDCAMYSEASDNANHRQFTLLTDIRQALKQPEELSLAFQPRINMRTGACPSAEALLRWRNPRLGNVSPGEFIPVVEQTALTRPVTEWVIDAALRQSAAWRKAGVELSLSINVSALDLEEADFPSRLGDALDRHGVPARVVELEFTESALIRNGARVLAQLKEVRSMGVDLAIDDFGTGYSTFSYLKTIPASTVKLDQSFMQGLTGSERDQRLVQSMIAMAHDLGYRVVAEGVETIEDYQFLADSNCDEAQGYLIARPLAPAAFATWFSRHGSSRSELENLSSQISPRGHCPQIQATKEYARLCSGPGQTSMALRGRS